MVSYITMLKHLQMANMSVAVPKLFWALWFLQTVSLVPQRILGTPTEQNWPGVLQLPDYKPNFPKWSGEGLRKVVPQLDNNGLDLLEVHLPYYFGFLNSACLGKKVVKFQCKLIFVAKKYMQIECAIQLIIMRLCQCKEVRYQLCLQ